MSGTAPNRPDTTFIHNAPCHVAPGIGERYRTEVRASRATPQNHRQREPGEAARLASGVRHRGRRYTSGSYAGNRPHVNDPWLRQGAAGRHGQAGPRSYSPMQTSRLVGRFPCCFRPIAAPLAGEKPRLRAENKDRQHSPTDTRSTGRLAAAAPPPPPPLDAPVAAAGAGGRPIAGCS